MTASRPVLNGDGPSVETIGVGPEELTQGHGLTELGGSCWTSGCEGCGEGGSCTAIT